LKPTWVQIEKEASAQGTWNYVSGQDIMDQFLQQKGYNPDQVQPMIVRAWGEAAGEVSIQIAPVVGNIPTRPFVDNGGFANRAKQSFGFPNNLRSFISADTKVAAYQCAQKVTFHVQVLAWRSMTTPEAKAEAVQNWLEVNHSDQ